MSGSFPFAGSPAENPVQAAHMKKKMAYIKMSTSSILDPDMVSLILDSISSSHVVKNV